MKDEIVKKFIFVEVQLRSDGCRTKGLGLISLADPHIGLKKNYVSDGQRNGQMTTDKL